MATTKSPLQPTPSASLSKRTNLAREHAASHMAQRGIARWTSGNSKTEQELAALLMPASQVNWHAQAQRDFEAWLQQGGFAGEARRQVGLEMEKRNAEATALPAAAPTSLRDTSRGIEILS
jgi:hypothetical protein